MMGNRFPAKIQVVILGIPLLLSIAVVCILSSLHIIPGWLAAIPPIIVAILGAAVSSLLQLLLKIFEDHRSINYKRIKGEPPPTDPNLIQQQENTVRDIYNMLIQPGTSAVVITGIAYVGKSLLAALVYHYAEEQRRSGNGPFKAEPLWLEVSPAVTMDDIAGTIEEALRKPFSIPDSLPPQKQAAALCDALNTVKKPRLIIVDQFDAMLDDQTGRARIDRLGVGEWIDAINGRECRCRILLTSRPFPLGRYLDRSIHLKEYCDKGLYEAEGIELLQKEGVDGSENELRRAVQRCEGHAHALHLLATLSHSPTMALKDLLNDRDIWMEDIADMASNFLSVIITQQASEVERRLLFAFSIYREPVPAEAVQSILDFNIRPAKIRAELRGLLTQHFLEACEGTRYKPHSIVANYVQTLFDMKDLRIAHSKAADYYQQRVTIRSPSREQRRQMSDLQPLIEQAWHLCQAERWQEAFHLIQTEGIFSDLKRWGGSTDLLELCRLLLPADKWNAEPWKKAFIYKNLGQAYDKLWQKEEARKAYMEALLLYRVEEKKGASRDAAELLNNMGNIYNTFGMKQEALSCYQQAFSIYSQLPGNHDEKKGEILNKRGEIFSSLGEKDKARKDHEQALSIFQGIGDRKGEAETFNKLGDVYTSQGKQEEALRHYEQALLLYRTLRDRRGEAEILKKRGDFHSAKGEQAEAKKYYEQAYKIYEQVGDKEEGAITCNLLGDIFSNLRSPKALRYYEKALPLYKAVGDRKGEAETLHRLGDVYTSQGKQGEAQSYYKQELSIYEEIGLRGAAVPYATNF